MVGESRAREVLHTPMRAAMDSCWGHTTNTYAPVTDTHLWDHVRNSVVAPIHGPVEMRIANMIMRQVR